MDVADGEVTLECLDLAFELGEHRLESHTVIEFDAKISVAINERDAHDGVDTWVFGAFVHSDDHDGRLGVVDVDFVFDAPGFQDVDSPVKFNFSAACHDQVVGEGQRLHVGFSESDEGRVEVPEEPYWTADQALWAANVGGDVLSVDDTSCVCK